MFDLSAFSLAELKSLPGQLEVEIARRRKEEKTKLLAELEALAAEKGFSLQDLTGETKKRKIKGAVAVKYRHPSDSTLTWSGRGRQPNWITAFVEAGGSLEQLSV